MGTTKLDNALGTHVEIDSTNIPDDVVIQSDIADGSINNDKLVSQTIQGNKVSVFQSSEITGTGSEANTAHSLGRTPVVVIVYPTENTTGNTLDLAEGTHDATNIKVNAPATCKYKIVAF